MSRSLNSTGLLLVLIVALAQGSHAGLPAGSDSRFTEYWGSETNILVMKQVGDSVLIQTVGPSPATRAPTCLSPLWGVPPLGLRGKHDDTSAAIRNDSSLKEGVIPIAEFRAFWDSLERLGFWRLDNAYRALASRGDEAGGEFSVSFETYDHHTSTKAVRFFAPESCSSEFRQVYALFGNMTRFAKSVPGWGDLLRYETDEPISGLKDWYHSEALRAIAATRDSQGLDSLLSMLVRNDDHGPAILKGLENIGSKRAIPALETFLALQEVNGQSRDTAHKEALALAAARVLVTLGGDKSLPAIRRYLAVSYHRLCIGDWSVLLAGLGDYSLLPEVLKILSDKTQQRYDRAKEAAGILERTGYRSQYVISMLFQIAETELGKYFAENGTVLAMMSAVSALTGQEFRDHYTDSREVRRTKMRKWLRWWVSNSATFPVGREGGSAGGYGFIQVNSTPPGAAIWLDGAAADATTPFLLLNVPVGRHELRLTREGCASWSSSATVAQGSATTVDAAMIPAFGRLQVNSSPSGAAISLDGANTEERTPHFFATLTTGKHDLELTRNRYARWDSTVLVAYGQTTTAGPKLRSMPESLWITYWDPSVFGGGVTVAGPERAVRFGVDSDFGYPLRITKVSAGFYYTRMDFPWPDSSFRFRIYKGDGRALLYESPVLEAVAGRTTVHELSTPISVDSGEFYVSVAPIDTNGMPANWLLRAVREDSSDRRSYAGRPGHWAPLTPGELNIAVLVRRYGSLRVNSTPSGAAIWLDTTNTGKTTPHLFSNVPARDYGVLLTKKGYADWHSSVAVAQDPPAEVDAALAEQPSGSLQVISTPAGTVITLDGVNTGRMTPYLFATVAPGTHHLELHGVYGLPPRGDSPRWDSTVEVILGQTTTAKATLKAPPESLWATYARSAYIAWGASWGVRTGPERVVKFNPNDFGLDYPVRIGRLKASFDLGETYPWPDSSFRFKIYGNDGLTLLYRSPALKAVPGKAKGPGVVLELSTPIVVDSGDFYLAVSPLDTSGAPSSIAVSGRNAGESDGPIPYPPANPNGRSYTGSPGHWSRFYDGEFLFSVQLQR